MTDPRSAAPHSGATVGDRRWTGATKNDLLGQRASQRSVAELNDTVVTTSDGTNVAVPELPSLESDVYVLEPAETSPRNRRSALLPSLHGLVLDVALSNGGDALWIDSQGHATTHTLSRIAPDERALKRVHVARAFTTHQHHTLVEQLSRWVAGDERSPFGTPDTDRPAVVVCPALDILYRDGELSEELSSNLLVRALANLSRLAREYDIPVILTRAVENSFTAPIQQAATEITLKRTDLGPRFECDTLDFETAVYETDDGLLQTTFAFWKGILASRHEFTEAQTSEEPTTISTDGSASGTGAAMNSTRIR